MILKRKILLLIMAFVFGSFIGACEKESESIGGFSEADIGEKTFIEEMESVEEQVAQQWEKGYNLPIDEQEAVEAENECIEIMELYFHYGEL